MVCRDDVHIVSTTVSQLIPFKDIACVHLLRHVIQARIVAVGDDGLGLGFEFL